MKWIAEPRLCRWLLCVVLQGCATEALLGDNSTVDAGGGESDEAPPTVYGEVDDEQGPLRFDVEEERVIAPTWRYAFDCGSDTCARGTDLRLAPDGTVWAVLQGGLNALAPGLRMPVKTDELVFVHLAAADGRVLSSHSRVLVPNATQARIEAGSELSIDGEGRPYVIRWPGFINNPPLPPGHVFRVVDGQVEEEQLPAGFARPDTGFLAGFPDGTFLEFSNQKEVRAERFSASGESLWRTSALRTQRQSQGGVYVMDPPTHLSDGSIVIDGLQKGDETTGIARGLSVLGPDGSLRWDMIYNGSSQQLAAGLDGGLLLASVRHEDMDLQIFAYDRRGKLLRSYRGARTGYHSVGPRALAVDTSGAPYVAVVVGDRRSPKLSLCKLATEGAPSARCVALDLSAPQTQRSENVALTPFMGVRMVVAAPDVVLLALAHLVGDVVTSSVVRVDLDAPGVSP